MSLTRRQKEILDFIRAFVAEHGYSPTLDEIARSFHLASLNGVHKHLVALEERGFLRRRLNHARSLQVLDPEHASAGTLPLLGYVAAGEPIEVIADPEEITVPSSMIGKHKNYVLKVRGSSMIDEHIQDGDYVIVEERPEVRNGELVIALVDGESVTLKKFYRETGQIRLQPANPDLQPIFLKEEQVRIQGVVVGVMRRYY